jgi:hypothetical protein
MTFVYLAIFAIIGAFARYGQSIVGLRKTESP